MMQRTTWDETWWAVAEAVSRRSRCVRRQIGAVIVTSSNRPISTGYNGPPAHYQPSREGLCSDWCPRAQNVIQPGADYDDCVSVHAEANALLFADRRDYEDGTIYVTSVPCWDCGKLIANSGLSRVVTTTDDRDLHRVPQRTVQLLADTGIEVHVR